MTRDDLEELDTRSLRALAKERLAAKARSLRTRASLLTALSQSLQQKTPLSPSPLAVPAGKTTGAAVSAAPTSAAPPRAAAAPAPAAPAPPAATAPLAARAEDFLIEEGFFLAPPAERPSPRPAALVRPAEGQALPPALEPPQQGDEVPHLLARDATTLFLFWDFRRDLERGAAFGLNAPRVRFHLFDAETLVRSVEAPLGRRSLYLEGLEPGHVYSVEAWLSGSDGHARPTGKRSAPLRLAPAAPSARQDVQLVRVPPEAPLSSFAKAQEATAPGPEGEAVGARGRLELPASLDWRGGPGPLGPDSGRP
jgi:hypothetical protein